MEGIILDEYVNKKYCRLLVIELDGTRKYYEPSSSGFALSLEIPAPASADHTHTEFGDVEITGSVAFTGSVYTEGEQGESVEITVPKVGKLEFKNGILCKFDPK